MATHARLSGSKAERWLNCPASVHLTDNQPSAPSTPEADEGTRAHQVAEMLLRGWVPPVEDDMVRHGRDYIAWLDTFQFMYPGVSLIEHRVEGDRIDADTGCILDFIHISPDTGTLIIVDYKYGAGVSVYPERNHQLLFGAALYMASVGREAAKYSTVILGIYQPRGDNPGGRVWYTDFATVLAFRQKIEAGVKIIREGKGQTKPGSWCRWCLAKASCRAHYDAFIAPAQAKAGEGVDTLTETECADLLDAEPQVRSFYKALAGRVKVGTLLTGTYARRGLVKKPGQSSWVDEAYVEAQHPVDKYPHYYTQKLRTPVQLAKLYPDEAASLIPLSKRAMIDSLVTVGDAFNGDDDG